MKKYSLALLLAGILSAACPLQGAAAAQSPELDEFFEVATEVPAQKHERLQRKVLLRLYNDLTPAEQQQADQMIENPEWNVGITPATPEEYQRYESLEKESIFTSPL